MPWALTTLYYDPNLTYDSLNEAASVYYNITAHHPSYTIWAPHSAMVDEDDQLLYAKAIRQRDASYIWLEKGRKSQAHRMQVERRAVPRAAEGTHEFSPCTPPSTCALAVRNSKRTRPSATPRCSSRTFRMPISCSECCNPTCK
jgi:hypothetical protein